MMECQSLLFEKNEKIVINLSSEFFPDSSKV